MSFGFSIGDIIRLIEISNNLYSTLTAGRRGAARDLEELTGVLFGLRCALDHLGRASENIIPPPSNGQSNGMSIEMKQHLDVMINSCGVTLQELEGIANKYREDVLVDTNSSGISTINRDNSKLARLKQDLKINWMKVRWDIERHSLKEYRDKLQSHTAAINIVLNTFIWSSTNRLEAIGEAQSKRIEELFDQSLQSNASLKALVNEILAMLVFQQSEKSQHPSHAIAPKAPFTGMCVPRPTNSASAQAHLVDANRTEMANFTMALDSTTNSAPINSIFRHVASNDRMNISIRQQKLPEEIVQLNIKRQIFSSNALRSNARIDINRSPVAAPPTRPREPPCRPSFLVGDAPNVNQLLDAITYLFYSLPEIAEISGPAIDVKKREMARWIRGFDHLLDEDLSSPSVKTPDDDLLDLMVHLNEVLATSDTTICRIFYQVSRAMSFNNALTKLQTVSKSVRIQKEIEEFEDEMESKTINTLARED